MERRNNQVTVARLDEKKLLDINELSLYLSIGRNKAMEIGEQAKAKVSIGRRALYNRTLIEKFVDEQTQEA